MPLRQHRVTHRVDEDFLPVGERQQAVIHSAAGPADQRFVLRSVGLDGPVAANRRYTVTLTDGSSVSGESDAQGRTSILQREAMHIAGVRIEESGA